LVKTRVQASMAPLRTHQPFGLQRDLSGLEHGVVSPTRGRVHQTCV
jgi:hypothetical protein